MSGISSGVGLISGINTAQLIEQLMALEARPIQNLQSRVGALDTRRAAFLDLSAQLMAIRNSVSNFHQQSFFQRFQSKSSNENVLLANASQNALPGSATIRVHSLVTNHAMVSRGFVDANSTPIGVGTMTIESSAARVDNSTELNLLNGGRGVKRGVIQITDRNGASAEVDLSRAFTIQDVLDAINSNTTIAVRASVTGVPTFGMNGPTGDRIVLEDTSSGAGNLSVLDVGGGSTAQDLGIAASVSEGRIDGADLMRIDMTTLLSALNDGNGIDRLRQGATAGDLIFNTSSGSFSVSLSDVLQINTDLRALNSGNGVRLGVIRITDRNGDTADVDLTEAATIGDVRAAMLDAGLAISVTTVNSRLLITDTSSATGANANTLKIEDISGHAAQDLGIAGEVESNSINGRDVYRVASVGDLVRAINHAHGNNGQVSAAISLDGKHLELTTAANAGTVTIAAGVDSTGVFSQAAKDLGILNATISAGGRMNTRRLVGGLNTTLLATLNGGAGVGRGVVSMTDGHGRSTVLDFSTAATLGDVIDLINNDTATGIAASVNRAGNGIVLRDESGGSAAMTISDDVGTLAADLNIAGTFAPGTNAAAESGNLQRQYISRRTSLAGLNAGSGIGTGTISITGTNGGIHQINVGNNIQTVGELIDTMNLVLPSTIQARINDRGDGILIEDSAAGAGKLTVADQTGRVASALRLVGEAKAGQTVIDGSFETTIEVGATDTLTQLAQRLNEANAGVSASIISDGSTTNPFSLTITSTTSGRRGAMTIDTGGLDLGLGTLTAAQDALVSVGTGGGTASILVASASNTLTDVLPGVTINLLSASSDEVTVTTDQDINGIVESIRGFVDRYNQAQGKIDELTSFNNETFARGTLFGDRTVDQVRQRLQRVMMRPFEGADPAVARLFNVGIRLGSGNRLEFNETRFRETYEQSPELVEQLFTTAETGLGAVLQTTLDEMTRSFDGLLARRNDVLEEQQKILNDRISQMNILLAAKQRRLESQFAGLESTLAALQDQQSALLSIAQLTAGG